MRNLFNSASHTFVVSDIHLADAEPPHPKYPLWKRFKRKKFFIDESFQNFLSYIQAQTNDPIELVLNGDIFDFDSILKLPKNPPYKISWLERQRGLNSEEPKSLFKMKTIIEDHSQWFFALKSFIAHGNRVVFVIGNHDIELHWPLVQLEILKALGVQENTSVRFVEWFYISNQDTLIEHGNQYDAYCLCPNPIKPLIKSRKTTKVRLPFGNTAGKLMLNGMGLMNPHSDSSFIKETLYEYIVFYFRYIIRTQPLILWTWFWSAMVTLLVTIKEGIKRGIGDPLTIADKVDHIAEKANGTTRMVWALQELHAHPACFNPIQTLRELWLDRVILFFILVYASFQFFTTLNVFVTVSLWWFLIPMLLLLPVLIFYARSVQSENQKMQDEAILAAPIAAQITKVKRVIQGHTHNAKHGKVGEIEYLNTGTWSPAFFDVECTRPSGKKCFAWIKPTDSGRVAELFEWQETEAIQFLPEL